MPIIRFFLERSFVINLISIILIIIGGLSAFNLKRDLVPQWQEKKVTITAQLRGASSEEMEKWVTFPLEESVKSLAGIKNITSHTSPGYTSIDLHLTDDFNEVDNFTENVKNIIAGRKSSLPQEVENLQAQKFLISSFWFSSISLLGYDFKNPAHLAKALDLEQKLSRLPGINRVSNYAPQKILTLKLNPKKLARYQVPAQNVTQVLLSELKQMPIGLIEKGRDQIAIQLGDNINSIDRLKNIIVKGNSSGRQVTIQNLGVLKYDFPKLKNRFLINGQPSSNLILFKDLDTDTLLTKRKLQTLIDEELKSMPQGLGLEITGDGPAFIERQLIVLNNNAFLGLILVVLSLYFFLGFKTAAMAALGLPMAYFTTFTIMEAMGIKIDLISIVGMILVIGILVDDAIIVAEQYNQNLEEGMNPKDAALSAVKTTVGPITGTVLTTMVAFAPILISQSGLNNFLRAIPIVVISALAISWIDCFFILPNHLFHFVKKPLHDKRLNFMNKMAGIYKKVLSFALKARYLLLLVFFGFTGFSLYFAQKNVPMNFNLNIGNESIQIVSILKESKNVDHTVTMLQPIQNKLKELPREKYNFIHTRVGHVWHNGKKFEGDRYAGISIRFSQTDPNLKENKEFIEKFLKENLKALKTDNFDTLSSDRSIDGKEDKKDNQVKVSISMNDQLDVDQVLKVTQAEAMKVEGTTGAFLDPERIQKTWVFNPNNKKLLEYGINRQELAIQLRGFTTPQWIKDIRLNGENIPLQVGFTDGEDLTFKDLNNLLINLSNGLQIPASFLGSWQEKTILKTVSHEDLKRKVYVDVLFDAKKINKDTFINDLDKQLLPLKELYPQTQFEVKNSSRGEEENKSNLLKMFFQCILLIIAILAFVLGSVAQPLMIISAIPFGIIGIIWAFYFQDMQLDVMAIIGVIGMAGVVVNDSLLMVDTINQKKKKQIKQDKFAIIDGASSRLRAIMLTSITTLGGVFPMAYGIGGDAGFTKSLAMSMGWGLSFATVLTLILIPCLMHIQWDILSLLNKVKNKVFKNKEQEELVIPVHTPLPEMLISQEAETVSDGDFVPVSKKETEPILHL